ncbi:MAG TPA: TIM barrel protein [Phycisphaerae bacterium]|nr:TIM barrel protein [Phycisphaerae bacterium]
MPASLGFSTTACPGWELRRMVETAQRLGFSGIELALGDGGGEGGSVPLWGAAAAVREMLAGAGLCVCSLATSRRLDAEGGDWKRERAALADALGLARELGAPLVTVRPIERRRGERMDRLLVRMAERLREVAGDACGEASGPAGRGGVMIVVPNGGGLRRARDLWTLLEAADAAHAGVCWDAGTAGDSPGLGVQTMNYRLKLARVWDYVSGGDAGAAEALPRAAALGTGVVAGRLMVQRARGIGFGGCIVYAPPPGATPAEEAEELLEAAGRALKGWSGPPAAPVSGQKKQTVRNPAPT